MRFATKTLILLSIAFSVTSGQCQDRPLRMWLTCSNDSIVLHMELKNIESHDVRLSNFPWESNGDSVIDNIWVYKNNRMVDVERSHVISLPFIAPPETLAPGQTISGFLPLSAIYKINESLSEGTVIISFSYNYMNAFIANSSSHANGVERGVIVLPKKSLVRKLLPRRFRSESECGAVAYGGSKNVVK